MERFLLIIRFRSIFVGSIARKMKRKLFFFGIIFSTLLLKAQEPKFEWAKKFGGTSPDYSSSIVVDSFGNTYTTGWFSGTVDFNPGSDTFNLTASKQDAYILKLDPSGNFIWAKSLAGNLYTYSYSIASDVYGNLFITGMFSETVDFDPGPGTFKVKSLGDYDIFICKLNSSGNFKWVKCLGGSSKETANAIALDTKGNIYTTGYFVGTTDFDPDTSIYNVMAGSNYSIFISKLDSAGNFEWVKDMGGSGYDLGISITTDELGNVYTTGRFDESISIDTGKGIFKLITKGGFDIFIVKFNELGDFVWGKNIGGTTWDNGVFIRTDSQENVYLTGSFTGTVDFDPGLKTFNLISKGDRDIFISKIDSSGNLVWAKNMGGSKLDEPYSMTIYKGNIYTIGTFEETSDFNPGKDSFKLVSAGGIDIFILKLDTSGNFIWAKSLGGISKDVGQTLTVDKLENVYSSGIFNGIIDLDPGSGTFNLTTSGNFDFFIHKISQCHPINTATTLNGTSISAHQTNASYQWIDCTNNKAIIGETKQIFTAKNNGNFAVIISIGSCSDTSECVKISTIGINGNKHWHDFAVYPNPTKEIISIHSLGLNDTNPKVQILNSTGQLVMEEKFNYPDTSLQINLKHLNGGVYMVRLVSDNVVLSSKKVIKL